MSHIVAASLALYDASGRQMIHIRNEEIIEAYLFLARNWQPRDSRYKAEIATLSSVCFQRDRHLALTTVTDLNLVFPLGNR